VLAELKQDQKNTVIVIEHSLENLIPLADQMILLANGRIALHERTEAFFQKIQMLIDTGISPPGAMLFFHELSQAGLYQDRLPLTVQDAFERLTGLFTGHTTKGAEHVK
jgi:ABC-type multidrug transport system ATPase subunit